MVLCFGTNACISRIKDGKVGLSAVGAAYKANLVLMSDSRIAELFKQLDTKVWSVQPASILLACWDTFIACI